ncbi:hypothetical protein CCYA_CCYA02G0639 [Cyanidiococcus yangmingshanensis]|nr:hypothetical protein CCYA_CCYA02G0639 [Cyanidiococcus yangmingshanensis]
MSRRGGRRDSVGEKGVTAPWGTESSAGHTLLPPTSSLTIATDPETISLRCIEKLLVREHLFAYPAEFQPPPVDSDAYHQRCTHIQRAIAFARRLYLSEEVVGLSVAYYDRIKSETPFSTVDSALDEEIIGAAALALACENCELPAALMVLLLAGQDKQRALTLWRTKQQLRAHLNWRIDAVTPFQFIRAIPKVPSHIRLLASGIVTLALCDVDLIGQLPSRIAAAAVAAAVLVFDELHEAFDGCLDAQMGSLTLERGSLGRTSPRSPAMRGIATVTSTATCPLINPQTLDMELVRRLLRTFFLRDGSGHATRVP